MTEKPRKTLSLPVLAEGERRPPNPKRKPVRGFAGGAKRVPPETAEVNPPKPATSTDWRKGSSARRGERPGDQGATASTQRRPRPSSSPDGEKRPGERAPAGRSEQPTGNGRNERPFEPRGDRPVRARDGHSVAGFKELGCCKLTLEVLSNNVSALRVYDHAGFAPYVLDPTAGQALFLEKKLAGRNVVSLD